VSVEDHGGRLAAEIESVRFVFPHALFVKRDGLIRILLAIRGRYDDYLCELTYPRDFPWAMMDVHAVSPKLRRCPHLLAGNRLCVCHGSDVTPSTSARSYCEWTKGWIRRYEDVLDGKPWIDDRYPDEH
jgi:hypothetical protein